MRLIDADALMQNIPSEEIIAKMAVAHAPTIERKHGEWIAGESWSDGYGMGEQYGRCYVCSECSHMVQDNYKECLMNFCPNCGADMKKE